MYLISMPPAMRMLPIDGNVAGMSWWWWLLCGSVVTGSFCSAQNRPSFGCPTFQGVDTDHIRHMYASVTTFGEAFLYKHQRTKTFKCTNSKNLKDPNRIQQYSTGIMAVPQQKSLHWRTTLSTIPVASANRPMADVELGVGDAVEAGIPPGHDATIRCAWHFLRSFDGLKKPHFARCPDFHGTKNIVLRILMSVFMFFHDFPWFFRVFIWFLLISDDFSSVFSGCGDMKGLLARWRSMASGRDPGKGETCWKPINNGYHYG